ncbi:bifunctional enoyl-CoA hydratase/phosphate acetyltransferase [Breznakiella homolactica]|uniref:Bifunctional enoyl-CoA hydratase/phosphate acetyltransferase n=1 Tax=Breznakiella homolactica TaxID=2798577 RepID=A0A7T8BBM0_9SPIR|nr:bifunctional enoyl-CoA hydratase/phosphate acetyltransferase [Breznakiella homolactica]QQO10205.1 bifunctional enoyl-CoA hydratase/phosphate acetyltransferase [Breznakiella homolactica]
MKTIQEIIEKARETVQRSGKKPPRIAIACAQDAAVLKAAADARNLGLGEAVLVGDREKIAAAARKGAVDISAFEIIQEEEKAAAAFTAVSMIREGTADLVMKGLVESADFLRAVLRKDMGLNQGTLISHVSVIESPCYHKLLFLTDGALNIAPGVEEKQRIIENAVALAHSLDIAVPKVALLAALEMVNPVRMPCTADAAILTQMNRRGAIPGCIVDGPLALDNAVSPGSVAVKGIDSPVGGDADILIAPAIEAGNILYKALMNLGRAKSAGLILGTRVPVILTSRADSAETKQASIALAVLAGEYRD